MANPDPVHALELLEEAWEEERKKHMYLNGKGTFSPPSPISPAVWVILICVVILLCFAEMEGYGGVAIGTFIAAAVGYYRIFTLNAKYTRYQRAKAEYEEKRNELMTALFAEENEG